MEVTTVVSIVGVCLTVFTVTMTLANMEPEKRAWLWKLWKRWLSLAFYTVLFVNSPIGILTFWFGDGPPSRGAVIALLLHFFNLCAGLVFLFMEKTEKALIARNARREDLEAKVERLEIELRRASGLPTLDG